MSAYRRWAKAGREKKPRIHLLVWHTLDVAAVTLRYLQRNESLSARLSTWLNVSPEIAQVLVARAIGLHDLGKMSASFQAMCREAAKELGLSSRLDGTKKTPHQDLTVPLYTAARNLGSPFDEETFVSLLSAAAGHHGKPAAGMLSQEFGAELREALCGGRYLHEEDIDAARELIAILDELLGVPEAFAIDPRNIVAASWLTAGLAILSDWLGSNERWFEANAKRIDPGDYWHSALVSADAALDESGVLPVPAARIKSPSELLGLREGSLRPMQLAISKIELAVEGPTITVIEDLTGAGKTEAAFLLAHRLISAGRAQRLFWALPTRATSDAMWGRIRHHWAKLFADGTAPSLVLAHGRADDHAVYAQSWLPSPMATSPDDEGAAMCSAWIADWRKRAFLGHVGVCTIDQLLLSALKAKHQQLRLLGLADAVLVMDEVHAADAYQLAILERVLAFQGALGGHAILLSATLPLAMRTRLMSAFHGATGWRAKRLVAPSESAAYPCVVTSGQLPMPVAAASDREFTVRVHHSLKSAEAVALAEAEAGKAVLLIRNAVQDSIESYRRLREHMPAHRILLIHSRFTMADRSRLEETIARWLGPASTAADRCGTIVVASPILGISLDVDGDVLVTDLCPVDVLLQRIGRMRRHARTRDGDPVKEGRPDERGEAVVHIITEPASDDIDQDWLKSLLPLTRFIYRDHGELWRTARLLPDGIVIKPVRDARALVESVYAENNDDLPEGLMKSRDSAKGTSLGHSYLGAQNSLSAAEEYPAARGDIWSDDENAPTRLAEQSVVLRLVALEEDGSMRPLCADGIAGVEDDFVQWRQSEVSVRRSFLARGDASIEGGDQRLVAALAKNWSDKGEWCESVVMRLDGIYWKGRLRISGEDRVFAYSREEGLLTPDGR